MRQPDAPGTSAPIRSWNVILIAAFLAAIGTVPLATSLGLGQPSGASEGRSLARRPAGRDLILRPGHFRRGFTKFYSDRFAFRNRLIAADSSLHYRMLEESISPRIIVGKAGWLFYVGDKLGVSADNTLHQYRGTVLLTEQQLANLRDRVRPFRDDAERRGARFLFTIVPNKEWVYPELLPGWVGPPGTLTIYDQIIETLRRDLGVDVLDLRRPLRDVATAVPEPIYYSGDSHWNHYGALLAHNLIARHLRKTFPDWRPLDPATMERVEEVKEGDLIRMLSLKNVTEVVASPVPKGGWNFEDADPPINPARPAGFSSSWYIKSTRNPGAKGPSLLVFHDSYMGTLGPFLSESCPEAVFVWKHDELLKFPGDFQPDLVIQEVAERAITGLTEAPLAQASQR